eukprot:scaffold134493_cov49-Tisochrysis_lutea.AAC.1
MEMKERRGEEGKGEGSEERRRIIREERGERERVEETTRRERQERRGDDRERERGFLEFLCISMGKIIWSSSVSFTYYILLRSTFN